MSADNWTVCPKCRIKVDTHQEELRAKAEKAYGTVSPEQYLDMIENIDDVELPNDLREDYEIYMCEDGEFFVKYSGMCITCGWEFKFRHSEKAE